MANIDSSILTRSHTLRLDTETCYKLPAGLYKSKIIKIIQGSMLWVCKNTGQRVRKA